MTKRGILVTGSTGKTGKKTVECLRNEGQEVRALVHKESAGSEYLKSIGAEVVVGDLLDINSIRAALDGTASAYFCYPLRPGLIEATAIFAQAAIEGEVGFIVNMSQICARPDAESHAALNHWISERLFDRSGIAITHLRPSFFAEWFAMPGLRAAINDGHVRLPFQKGLHAPIAAEDQARLIAEILQRPAPHAGKIYKLCGRKQRTYKEWFSILSGILGREIRYEVTSDAETRRVFSGWFNEFLAQHIVAVAKDYDNGVFAGTDDVIEKLTGRKPIGFEEFIGQHSSLYQVG